MAVLVTGDREWVADLDASAPKLRKNVKTAVERTSRNIKNDTRSNAASGGRSTKKLGAATQYELKETPDSITSDVGPTLGGAGRLVNLAEGGFGGRVASTPFMRGADGSIEKNIKDFETGIEKAQEDSFK